MWQIPEPDALRMIAYGLESRALQAELENLEARHQKLFARRLVALEKAQSLARKHGMDPETQGLSGLDDPHPLGVVLSLQTSQPVPKPEPPQEPEPKPDTPAPAPDEQPTEPAPTTPPDEAPPSSP